MNDPKTKDKESDITKKLNEVYGPSPVLSILDELKELLDDKEQYPW